MILDEYGRCGVTEKEMVQHLLTEPDFDFSRVWISDADKYDKGIFEVPRIQHWKDRDCSVDFEDYHERKSRTYLMPDNMIDVEEYLLSKCKTVEQTNRVKMELSLYRKNKMMGLLSYLIYLRDVAREHGIVWGVGRGSSCASYCLFLIGVHRIDSLLYDLDIREFFKESE